MLQVFIGCKIPIDKQNQFGITREEFNCEFEFPSNEKIISISEGICNNELTVIHTIEPMQYDFNELDWNVKYTDSSGSFQLYLQCLYPIVYLTKAYELSEDKRYLDMAEKLILSWIDYSQSSENRSSNSMIWNDHGAALRTENIIYYTLTADKAEYLNKDTKNIIVELLNRHAEFLLDDSNYTKNHNHGIFQDRAFNVYSLFS
ncbi:MAG: heparinase II/III family protein [Methanobacteriaceae archaeon]|nr:heparinase II/III family protein [Methanobacteriaceae archaeon]